MHQKQRAVYHKIRQATKQQPADDKACEATLKECDKLNVELRQIEQNYHQKMMKAIPAKKVYDAIMAENQFHRRMMRGWGAPNGQPNWGAPNGQPNWGAPNGQPNWQNPFGGHQKRWGKRQ
jgi:hypothetical protein